MARALSGLIESSCWYLAWRPREWLVEKDAQLMLEQDTGDTDGYAAQGEHEQQAVVLVHGGITELPEGTHPVLAHTGELHDQSAQESEPGLAVVDDKPDGGAHVEAHEKHEKEGLRRGLAVDEVVPPEQRRQQHPVTEARNGEQFRDSLH